MGVSYVTTYVLNKNLNEYELGKYSYIYNLLNLFFPLLSISIYSSYLRFENSYNSKKLISFVLTISVVSSLIFAILIYIKFEEVKYLFFAFIILFQERMYLLRAQQKILLYNIFNVMQKLAILSLVRCFIKEIDAQSIILFSGLSYLIPVFFCFVLHKLLFGNVSSENSEYDFKVLIKFSVTVTLMTVVTWVSSVSDQLLIKHFFDFETVASYAVAFRIITMIALFSGIFLSYYPIMYFKDMDNYKSANIKLFRNVFFVLLIFLSVVFALFVNWVYVIFGAEKYIETKQYFIILVFAEVLRIMASVLMTFKTYQLKQSYILYVLIFISLLNLALNYIFIPIYGAISAAYSTLFVYSIYFLFSLPTLLEEKAHFKNNKFI